MIEGADDWSPPAEIEEYRLVKPLGRGAMGQVYLAHDTLLDRHVAVKFVSGATPDPRAREQFFVEARAIARLSHPNVVAIHRVGEVRRRPYLVSEFVHGRTLAEVPRPVPSLRLLEIGIGLSRGLAAAHRRGVLHRDLKPANAMITDDGEVKLLDFGLAMVMDAAPLRSPSIDGQIGSPLYMAPEIWRGEPATRASDIYSIGVFLYELAVGHAPNQDIAPVELSRAAQDRDVAPLCSVAPEIDARLGDVVDRCLSRDPAARWDSGDALRAALEALMVATRAAPPEGNPYRGLAIFEAEHQGLFFGREAETRAIVERLRSEAFVVVAGDSGVGKSSLCRAGVLPRLEGRVVSLVPGRHPLTTLCAALAPILDREETVLAALLRDDPAALGRELRQRAPLVLFVDQMEELATLAQPDEVAIVAEALATLTLPAPGVRLLASVRSDFLTRLSGLPALGRELARALYLLPPLSPEHVRDAVLGPLTAKGFCFAAPSMADEIAAVADEAGGLPLVQFALAQLWEARDVGRRLIPADALARMGGPAGALARHADSVLAALLPPERAVAQRMLIQLVQAEGTRARRSADDLVQGEARARTALEALVRGRLVIAREDTYEIAHEALVAHWDTLRGWLSQNSERRANRQRLERAAAEWERLGRVSGALWSSAQLAEASGVEEPSMGSRDAGFLVASRRAVRRRRILGWAAVLGLPVLALGVYGAGELSHRRDVNRRVAGYEAQAGVSFARARTALQELEHLRAEAFARFDAMDRDGGEARWKEALGAAKAAGGAAQAASDALETALRLDQARGDVRAAFGDVLEVRARIADLVFQRASRDELLARLALNDEDGTRRARWTAPAEVELIAPPGASLQLFRYDDREGHRVAVPLAAPRMPRLALAPGSYLAIAGATRLPFVVAAGEASRIVLEPPPGPVSPGFLYVPRGRFQCGSSGNEEMRRTFFNAPPLHTMETPAFLIARNETTYADWIEFLDTLSPREREPLIPHGTNFEGNGVVVRKVGASWELALRPKDQIYRARWGEPIRYLDRDRRSEQDWRRMPVAGVSFRDAERYARWLDQSGRVPGARLCSDVEWERAARGADDREYPGGDRIDPDDANFDLTYGQKLAAFGPDEVGSHPASRSPYGADDMAGNIYEWTRSSAVAGEANVRGACFYYNREMVRVYNREPIDPSDRTAMIGIRLCADVR